MKEIIRLAQEYQDRAWEVVRDTRIIEIWQSVGAEVNLVGSLRTGLLIRNRDVDFHIYTRPFKLADSFAAIARLAENPRIKKIAYANLLEAEDRCVEWHASYEDRQGDFWQIDMIHILPESRYAGWFEKVADRIKAVLEERTREAILSIKNAVPEGTKVPGIKIYMAVLRDGVRSYERFVDWDRQHPAEGIVDWSP